MLKKLLLLIFICSLSAPAYALQLAGATALAKGKNRIAVEGSVLFGITSPPSSFTESTGNNKPRMFEQKVSYARGFGDWGLKDVYLEVEALSFQSRQETFAGAVVHSQDTGFAMTLRGGGNFVHTQKVTFGMWLQTSIPIVMDKNKFVNPVLSYVGGGLNTVIKISNVVGFSQSVYLGSGLFSPNKRNPYVQSTTLGLFNFGHALFDHDVVFKLGGVIESDLTSRIDANYQASALGDGRIKNLVFITPFILEVDLGKDWSIEAGHAIKWKGKSVRGSQFSKFSLAKKF